MDQGTGMTAPVDGYLRKNKRWAEQLQRLRQIVLACGLVEQVKWRVPCYTFENRNVIILGAFKEYCAISFVKGAMLKDVKGILARPGENTQSARVVRLRSVREIDQAAAALKDLVHQAIDLEKAGAKFTFKKIGEHAVPVELAKKLDESPRLKAAFGGLTPGRRRAYLLYVSGARQSRTREARVEKCVPRILAGKGLDD